MSQEALRADSSTRKDLEAFGGLCLKMCGLLALYTSAALVAHSAAMKAEFKLTRSGEHQHVAASSQQSCGQVVYQTFTRNQDLAANNANDVMGAGRFSQQSNFLQSGKDWRARGSDDGGAPAWRLVALFFFSCAAMCGRIFMHLLYHVGNFASLMLVLTILAVFLLLAEEALLQEWADVKGPQAQRLELLF